MNIYVITALPLIIAFAVTACMGPAMIPWLHKLKFGQEIREIGPSWHKKKAGTPTMGGIMFIAGTIAAAIAVCIAAVPVSADNRIIIKALLTTAAAAGFGAVGFVDDYIKVVKKRNLGLRAAQKFILQLVIACAYIIALYALNMLDTVIDIPFTGISIEVPVWLYVVFLLLVITGTVNAVNLTDGIDGLAASVSAVVFIFFGICAVSAQDDGIAAVCSAALGGMLGFLLYNHHPARVFMGDTGSLFIGGAVAVSAVALEMPLFLVIAGFVYFAETLSVIIQVTSFKLTGKRVFKMSPIHHHFEMCGWSERKIVTVFTLAAAILCVAAYIGYLPFAA